MSNVLPETNTQNQPADTPQPAAIYSWRSLGLLVGTVTLTLVLVILTPVDLVHQFGDYGYLGIFIVTLLANATILLPSPALAAAFIGGAALNPWIVGVVSGVAAGLGEITGYIAGYSGSELATRSTFYPRVEYWVRRWGVLTIFVLAVIPLPIIDLAGIAAGILRVRFTSYLLACIAGKTLRYIGVAWAGHIYI